MPTTHPLEAGLSQLMLLLQTSMQIELELKGDYLPEHAVVENERYGFIRGYTLSPDQSKPGLTRVRGGFRSEAISIGMIVDETVAVSSNDVEGQQAAIALGYRIKAALPNIINNASIPEDLRVYDYEIPPNIDVAVSQRIKNRNILLLTASTEFRLLHFQKYDLDGVPV